MPRPVTISLSDVASWSTLTWAFWRASRGKRDQRVVSEFQVHFANETASLRDEILNGHLPCDDFHEFWIRDPKLRRIRAPSFRLRVMHHALMAHVGPIFDRYLVDDTYACRVGKGALAAVKRVQQHVRRFPWYVQVDARAYFDSIDHGILKRQIRRRIRGADTLRLIDRIIDEGAREPGRGLPIGALTSQYFANLYLAPFDRFLSERLRVAGMVRYMDDTAWWCHCREETGPTLARASEFLQSELRLDIKPNPIRQRSERGITFCGFRVLRGSLRLTPRRKRRYRSRLRHWERAYLRGDIDGATLQRNADAALAITAHADALAWRRADQQRRRQLDV